MLHHVLGVLFVSEKLLHYFLRGSVSMKISTVFDSCFFRFIKLSDSCFPILQMSNTTLPIIKHNQYLKVIFCGNLVLGK